ncbi:hypothetical protein SDC9_149502 [bioreactor metagenome]|uniref:Uncharacterized protein n=1 Tax=bioreactor metagenome TaxID=1076179 RepID=A0A645EJV0_9ZZZZ
MVKQLIIATAITILKGIVLLVLTLGKFFSTLFILLSMVGGSIQASFSILSFIDLSKLFIYHHSPTDFLILF